MQGAGLAQLVRWMQQTNRELEISGCTVGHGTLPNGCSG